MGVRGQQLTETYAYRQFADEIEKQIMQGMLKPGERLPGEVALAEMFGVTRSTVREGLRQLESEGLVCRPTPRRLEVAQPQSDKLSSRSSRAMVLMNVTFRELWQVALETEPLAAALAAKHATREEMRRLEKIHADLIAAKEHEAETIRLDTRFHALIAESGKNRALSLAREPIALLLYQGFTQVAPKVPQGFERQITAHANLLAAISDRDAERAREWSRRHVEDFWRGIQLAGLEDATPITDPSVL